MKTINAPQGSPEWLAHRANTYNASDAPAATGCSPYKTRTQLLDELVTGIAPEHDAATERRFADGHRFEALARPLAEQIIGDELYPVTGTEDTPSFSRALGASFDGLTLMNDTAFEHKTLNERLRYDWDEGNGDHLPKDYRVQMEQQMLVSGAERVLFMATRWAGDECVERKHCWYSSDPALRAELLAAWKQIDADRATHVPAATVEKVVAEPVEALPAPVVQVTGQIALQDNFKVFETRLRDFLENKLIRAPKTDQDFADLDGQIKAMKAARESLKAAEAQMLAQVQPVDQAKKTKDMLDSLLQKNVKMAEDMLTAEKDRRKGEIVAGGVAALKAHIDGLNTRLGKPYMPVIPADFGGAVRGLKSLTSMEDKVSGELARAKIAAHEVADRIDANLKYLRENAEEYKGLFADAATIVLKNPDDLQALAKSRIADHKVEIERQAEAQRERIRQEEQAKAEKEAREKVAAEQAEAKRLADEQAERDAEAARQATAAAAPAPTPAPAPVAAPAPAPAANVVPLTRPAAPPVDTGARVKLGDINAAIAPLSITADGLAALGFPHVATDKSAKLYSLAALPAIYAAMVRHIEAVQEKAAA